MTLSELTDRIRQRLGIAELNDMQRSTSAITAGSRSLLLAPTGSGKTLAFAIPFIMSLRKAEGDDPVGVIIAPTRELVLQIFEVVRTLATPDFKTAALYGGHDMRAEQASLSGKPEIIIATPGRLLDHLHRGNISLFAVRSLVLDEYDKSLELGFHDDMRAIVGRMRSLRTLILTSATAAAEVPDFITTDGLKRFDFTTAGATTPDVEIFRVNSADTDKLETLDGLLRRNQDGKSIIFLNHRDAAERVYNYLRSQHYPVGLYHGGLEQQDRERALILFDNGTTPVLVSTDLASRGLDIGGVDNVIHYHLAPTPESNTHRNGRTARMGRSGRAFYIISSADKVPAYIPAGSEYRLEGEAPQAVHRSGRATLFFNAGKKEKISRGDIAGFLMQKGELGRDEVGKIDVKDHCAYAAVPAAKARETVEKLAPHKIKNTRVRVTQLKNK
ncbi:MAG: DEAD/DEAH box helicase [Bacteroidales bacterium]|nr:DEAD/DEAH box helicase [Bacteroidales bacterium]